MNGENGRPADVRSPTDRRSRPAQSVVVHWTPTFGHRSLSDPDLKPLGNAIADESTINACSTAPLAGETDRFSKYLDCQDSLVELSFITWIAGFRDECRRIGYPKNPELYYGLLNFFNKNIGPEIIDSRNKVKKSFVLKKYVHEVLSRSQEFHNQIQLSDALNTVHYYNMNLLVAHYIDLSLITSQQNEKTLSFIYLTFNTYLNDNIDNIFDSIFQLSFIFNISKNISLGPIMLKLFQKLLGERHIPVRMKFLTYLRYILCFKLWKKTAFFSNLNKLDKNNMMIRIRLLLQKLNPPEDFMNEYGKYKLSSLPDEIKIEFKNLTFHLYSLKFSCKNCIKDILGAVKKTILTELNRIEKQCSILRPDLFAVEGNIMLEKWNTNFDVHIKPRIPFTCHSDCIKRNIPYNDMIDKSEENTETISICNKPLY